MNHFFEVNQAQDVDELDEVIKRNQGVPWVNTIAADSDGDAYYADISVVPHVTNEKAATCNTVLGRATFEALRLPVLDGSLLDTASGAATRTRSSRASSGRRTSRACDATISSSTRTTPTG